MAVTITHLVKRYGDVTAVDDVSLAIHEGEIFGIIGPNGAGKTTTVECISGLRAPYSGTISVFGLSLQHDRDKIREFVGVQLQESALPPRLRVGEAVELFASFYPNPLDSQEVLQALAIADMERSAFKTLSGGEKQRVSIALALVGMPLLSHHFPQMTPSLCFYTMVAWPTTARRNDPGYGALARDASLE